MSDTDALEGALQAARVAADADPSPDPGGLARAGSAAIEGLRRCESHPAWRLQIPGEPDPLMDTRHGIRAAAQEVLEQLELIKLAWPRSDPAARGEMLAEVEAAGQRLTELALRFTSAAG